MTQVLITRNPSHGVPDPKFWTATEAAAMLRVSKDTVYRLLRKRTIESIRIGGSYRIPDIVLQCYASGTIRTHQPWLILGQFLAQLTAPAPANQP